MDVAYLRGSALRTAAVDTDILVNSLTLRTTRFHMMTLVQIIRRLISIKDRLSVSREYSHYSYLGSSIYSALTKQGRSWYAHTVMVIYLKN